MNRWFIIELFTDIFGDGLQFEERAADEHNIDPAFGKL